MEAHLRRLSWDEEAVGICRGAYGCRDRYAAGFYGSWGPEKAVMGERPCVDMQGSVCRRACIRGSAEEGGIGEEGRSGTSFGGEPFVLLFDPITFGSPTRGKEIDVVVNH